MSDRRRGKSPGQKETIGAGAIGPGQERKEMTRIIEKQPRGTLTICQWENHLIPAKDDEVYLLEGNTGTKYLVCLDCGAPYTMQEKRIKGAGAIDPGQEE